ncbi:hypothetical protein M0811_00812 [Anaeramoeba ignava]|uniref:BTB domain-containing protein n=1 Tax=Anaeramoeba ignava TaxID=1746090 RepID=A0A9Q0LMM5_ANAIG|nr:hypothetical protein M0811_00812 [Anaeramoeba ignava]
MKSCFASLTNVSGDIPIERAAHSVCIYEDKMYIFGGYNISKYLNDIYSFSFTNKIWKKESNSENKPIERRWSSSVLFNNKIWIFGGYQNIEQRFNDVYYFDLINQEWTGPIQSENAPSPRYSHTAVVYNNKMWVFGGFDGSVQSNSVYTFDFATFNWEGPIKTVGQPPKPRAGHTTVIYKQKAYIFGGYNKLVSYLNDVYSFDFQSFEWTFHQTSGSQPSVRSLHSASIFQHYLYIYGGYNQKWHDDLYCLNMETFEWQQIKVIGRILNACYGHSSVIYQGNLYLFGGYSNKDDKRNFFNSLISFRFHSILAQDLRKFFKRQELCDIVYKTKNGKLGAHQCILQARCGNWEMISSLVSNQKYHVVKSLFEYIYSGIISFKKFSIDDYLSLLFLCSELNISRLLKECKRTITCFMNPNNVVSMLLFAENWSLKFLKEICYRFIITNKESVGTNLDSRLTQYPELMLEYIKLLSAPSFEDFAIQFHYSSENDREHDTNTNLVIHENSQNSRISNNGDYEMVLEPILISNEKSISTKMLQYLDYSSVIDIEDTELSRDYEKMLLNNKTKDFKIKVGDEYVLVHKAILAARSDLFRGMLISVTNDFSNCAPEVSGRSFESVQALVKIMYTGSTSHIEYNTAIELINASDYYGLNREFQLDTKCIQVIANNLHVGNALHVLEKSLFFKVPSLKELALRFIIKNGHHLLEDPSFIETENYDILKEIIHALITNVYF